LNLDKLNGVDIVIISTVPFFLVNQLSSHIYNLKEKGMRVTLVTSAGEELQEFLNDDSIQVITIEIPRKIELWADLKALVLIVKLFSMHKFTIMHSTTPKAGLLCAIAAKITGIPVRLHTFTGQVWATKTGLMKNLLQFLDKIIVQLSTHCYVDSLSQQQFLIDSGIAKKKALSIYGKGSLAGVDLKRFSQDRFSSAFKTELKKTLDIKGSDFILTFIGRLIRDKGIYELLASFEQLQKKFADIQLILLGPMEASESDLLRDKINNLSNVHWLGNVRQPEQYLSITDVLCLPSYREGFGTVVIEAAAMGVPTVGTEIPGLVDAVDNNVTGNLVRVKDITELSKTLETLVCDDTLLQQMKKSAKERCLLYFDSQKVNECVALEYVRWLK